ncbi:MAG: FAD-dependent oxidoreductase [Gemmatimonadota bacterium]|nr:MAG: FAD-dependent oxidoreductase [Gemmatimonadota bacterium]
MARLGSRDQPLRVAIIGSGPAGFYAAEKLLKQRDVAVTVDMYDRLPVPFGLVRFGVAPDHEKIKNVTRVFEKVAANPGFRFFGNVEIGSHISRADLERHYHQICYATGAQTDRRMGIPGEDLRRSHPATEFVAWYNGHPDYRDLEFDLSVERVAVVGVGNVAVDVARVLCRTPEELEKTDIADYALEALRRSRVKEVYVLGRRGPAQAAFTNPEVKELGELAGADLAVLADEVALDELSRATVEESGDKTTLKRIEILQSLAGRGAGGKPKRLTLRFLVSPVELFGNEKGEVAGMRVVRNELYVSDDGSLRPRPTEIYEDLAVDMVFRSVGYRGVPLAGLPFHDRWGIIPNESGRVTNPEAGKPLPGIYVAGWIKRGPSGVIGTNKPDAGETVECMLRDLAEGIHLEPADPSPAAAEALVARAQPAFLSWDDWRRLQDLEESRGARLGRPRLKMTSVEEMLAGLRGSGEAGADG